MALTSAQVQYYSHSPLSDTRSIRVLDLEPSPFFHTPLRGSLRELRFPDDSSSRLPCYALSYVWDEHDPNNSTFIYIETAPKSNECLEITPNCATALRHLRWAKKTRTLWVDAICIDQTSNEEKRTQIALMGDLYARASRVVIWLDLGDMDARSAKAALRFLRTASWLLSRGLLRANEKKKFQRLHLIAWLCEKTFFMNLRRQQSMLTDLVLIPTFYLVVLQQCSNESGAEILCTMLTNRYFQRIWTVQEFMLAQKADALVVTAHESCSLEDFALGMFLFAQFPTICLSLTSFEYIDIISNNSVLVVMQSDVVYDEEAQLATRSRRANIMNIHYLQCSEPRDKAYAFLWALRARAKEKNVENHPIFNVDYENKSVQQVFKDLAIAFMEFFDPTLALYSACQPTKGYDLPTWVSDWNNPHRRMVDYLLAVGSFDAGTSDKPFTPFEFHGNSLFLRGVLATTVTKTFNIFEDIPEPRTVTDSAGRIPFLLDGLSKVINHVKIEFSKQPDALVDYADRLGSILVWPSGDFYLLFGVIWRVLLAFNDLLTAVEDSRESRFMRTKSWQAAMKEILIPHLGQVRVNKYLKSVAPFELSLTENMILLNSYSEKEKPIFDTLMYIVPGVQSIFFTADGHIGVGTNVQKGDSVAVWDTIGCPVVIRRIGSTVEPYGPWSLISMGSISGLMQGEAYRDGEHIRFEVR